MKKLILTLALFFGIISLSYATNYYVRPDGGSLSQCNGTSNTAYTPSGSNIQQGCAFNHPRYATGWDQDNPQSGVLKSGDTVYVSGDKSDGTQAQYLIGYDDSVTKATPTCSQFWPWDCTLKNLPAGISSTQRTSIIGVGNHKPQFWGNERVWQVLSANNSHILLQNLEITDHQACAYNDPSQGCTYSGSYPYGAWSEDGLYIGGDDVNLVDVYVHGVGRYGINTDNLNNIVFTRVQVIGNGYGGISTGTGATISGTLIFNQPTVEWNGCVEGYPITSVDDPNNYTNCFGQKSGGYGDGIAFGNTGHGNAGNWTIIGPGSISFNTQDGLDTLHGTGTGTIQIDKMRFEGNAGNQVKMNALVSTLTNSVVIGDCGWWFGAKQINSGFSAGDICRALGDAILINVTNSSTTKIYNNTILSNGNIALESEDLNGTGCNSSTSLDVKNNIIQGGYTWIDDTTFNGSGGNSQTTYIYNDGSDGNGAGSCGSLKWNEDYNIVTGTKNNNNTCLGSHDKCGVNPGFTGMIPMGTSGGNASTYYQGNNAIGLIALNNTSSAIGSGISGLVYWNNSNDYNNVVRSVVSLGAEELNGVVTPVPTPTPIPTPTPNPCVPTWCDSPIPVCGTSNSGHDSCGNVCTKFNQPCPTTPVCPEPTVCTAPSINSVTVVESSNGQTYTLTH